MSSQHTPVRDLLDLLDLLDPKTLDALSTRLHEVLKEHSNEEKAQLVFEFLEEGIEGTHNLLTDTFDSRRIKFAEGFLEDLVAHDATLQPCNPVTL